MSKSINKFFKAVAPIHNKLSFGATGMVDNVLDKYLGTDINGFRAEQERAKADEIARNQASLNSQLNANILGVQGTDNIAQVEAGGSAADAASSVDNRRRRAGTISSTLGI
ncbi:hypothetical protein [Pectobacterium phage PPWS1]|uniref:Uncharacterized protein n=2 Tax=Kotilavirus TaxID=2732921 RepID=A0A0P0UW41_9CAUD|nr:virion structural protein [Pectobacterium phage PPWS1]YP_009816204.1 virion structural protein [Pectobacterium phage PPWS2]BAS69553.1 hypothetical protein [Pectobacterium phage PPWS1]BBD74675.1 putative structural protein [Pectobacterium phage PPWS2]